MSDMNTRAAIGQAMNLAVNDALHNKQEDNQNYILQRYLKYYKLCGIVQKYKIEEIESLIHTEDK